MIKAERQRQNAAAADAAVGWLDTRDAAIRRRDANRTPRVGAKGHGNDAGGNGRGRSPARTAWNAIGVSCVVNVSVVEVLRGNSVSQFVKVRLADGHCARNRELFNGRRVVVRNEVAEYQ